MKNYKVTLMYDGSRYDGWQKQGNTANTIQGKIEALLSRLMEEPVKISGAGRTDAGVHAKGQVFHVKLNTTMTSRELLKSLNQYLPEDIAVTRVQETDMRFHARLNATGKVYEYRIHNSAVGNPFLRKYSYQVKEKLDVEMMRRAAEELTGTWDFLSFCSTKRSKKSTVRTIYEISIIPDGDDLLLIFRGNGFLYNMVRILTGTLIEVGLGMKNPESMKEILEKKDRAAAGYMAPAQGLCLVEVEYDGFSGKTFCEEL